MKCFIIDFSSISFVEFKVHGGGDFALRAVEFLESKSIDFFVINNNTGFFKERSLVNVEDNRAEIEAKYTDIYYFHPLYYEKKVDHSFDYRKRYFYMHGLRVLEMPYDATAHLYRRFPKNVLFRMNWGIFKRYYRKMLIRVLDSVERAYGENIILTPSEHSKYVMKSVRQSRIPIEVLPPFLSKESGLSDKALPTAKKYILFLNGDRWVKNSYRFLVAFKRLKKQGELKDIDLVMTGKPRFAKKFTSSAIHYMDYVDRAYLEKLMKNCYFLAYPSLNEGFGYPPLDVFKYGKPVLCTAISSPNILYNGSVVFTNPQSIDEIKSRILFLIDNYTSLTGGEQRYSEMSELIETKWSQFFEGHL